MAGIRIPRSRQIEKDFFGAVHEGRSLLSGLIIQGAQLMLQRALEEEVSLFLGRGHYQRSGVRKGYRNGYRDLKLMSSEGLLEVGLPKVRQSMAPFHSSFLGAWQRRSEVLEEMIPALYVKGLSDRDIEDLFQGLLKGEKVSRSAVSRLSQRLAKDFKRFRERELSELNILYLFLDGIYLPLRQGTKEKECVLVAWGIQASGKKILLHLSPGYRESYDSWKVFLEDMLIRGLNEPLLVISDRNAGLRRTIRECFPRSFKQQCQAHKMRNILAKLPRSMQREMKSLLHKVFRARNFAEGAKKGREPIRQFSGRYPEAMRCLEKDLEEVLTCLKFPEAHRKIVRTTNLLERLMGEVRRRTKVIPRFPSEKSTILLVYAVMIEVSKKWRGVRMTAGIVRELQKLREEKFPQPEIADEKIKQEEVKEKVPALA